MGRIRTKDIKDLARDLYDAYKDSLNADFENNKTVMGELKITEGKSKRFRNRVAGYVVRLARQAAYGTHAVGERASETNDQMEAEVMEQAVETEDEQQEASTEEESTEAAVEPKEKTE